LLINKEALLHAQIINNIHLVSFSQGFIKVRLKIKSDLDILKNLSNTLEKLTKSKWVVSISEEEGEKTIAEKESLKLEERKNEIRNNPEFSEVFKYFPDAKIISIEDKN
jgi:DNA polymerase-3 subunit gamma/tau